MSTLHSSAQIANARQIYDFWIAEGAKAVHAAALIGNTEGEDSLDPALVGDHDQAYNIGQWHWRPRGIYIYEQTGIDIRKANLADALKAQAWEMQNPKSWYRAVWPNLMATQTLRDAVTVVVHQFEQSASQDRDVLRRTEYASYWLEYAKENWS